MRRFDRRTRKIYASYKGPSRKISSVLAHPPRAKVIQVFWRRAPSRTMNSKPCRSKLQTVTRSLLWHLHRGLEHSIETRWAFTFRRSLTQQSSRWFRCRVRLTSWRRMSRSWGRKRKSNQLRAKTKRRTTSQLFRNWSSRLKQKTLSWPKSDKKSNNSWIKSVN